MSAELEAWPPKMLDIIARPERVAASGDVGGEFSPDQLEAALGKLDPTAFRDQDEWLQLMFACHSATKGEGGLTYLPHGQPATRSMQTRPTKSCTAGTAAIRTAATAIPSAR